jgi:hypothetical protein
VVRPASFACLARSATLVWLDVESMCCQMQPTNALTMSSYELLVHDPISAAEKSSFHPCSLMNAPNFDKGVAKSGVKGPLIVGSSSDKF